MGPLNLPNALSALRLALVPVLLALAFAGHRQIFTALLVLAFATDVLDGFLARRLGQTSVLGAKLDSWGDFGVYMSSPLCAWWLVPEVFTRNLWFFVAAAVSVLLPALVAFVKFRQSSSYHTWLVKVAAVLTGASLVLLFLGGPDWPFRLAVPVSVLAALEEIAITWVLRAPRSNVSSLRQAIRLRRSLSPSPPPSA